MADKKALIEVKLALAEKYERLARVAGSDPKRKRFSGRAVTYRAQAKQMERESR